MQYGNRKDKHLEKLSSKFSSNEWCFKTSRSRQRWAEHFQTTKVFLWVKLGLENGAADAWWSSSASHTIPRPGGQEISETAPPCPQCPMCPTPEREAQGQCFYVEIRQRPLFKSPEVLRKGLLHKYILKVKKLTLWWVRLLQIVPNTLAYYCRYCTKLNMFPISRTEAKFSSAPPLISTCNTRFVQVSAMRFHRWVILSRYKSQLPNALQACRGQEDKDSRLFTGWFSFSHINQQCIKNPSVFQNTTNIYFLIIRSYVKVWQSEQILELLR